MNREKKPIKPIKILKKLTGSVRFRFYKPETKKTKPNRTRTQKNRKKTEPNRKKTEKTKPSRFEPVFFLKNRTKPGRFEPVSIRFQFF
jgi:hypothetical protein